MASGAQARSRSCRTTSSSSRRCPRSAPGAAACASRRPPTTTGNAPLEVELSARDREDKFTVTFAPPHLHLEPNTPTDARLTATPRRPHWIGRPRERTLAITASAQDVPPPPTQIVAVRQRAWIPFWFPPLLLALAALAAAFVLTRPDTATMPELTGETFNAAQLATARAGFTQTPVQQTRQARRRAEIGAVVEQEPAPGTEAKPDAKIVLVVGVGRERTSVPDLKGMDLDQAQTALRKAKLKLGPANGDAVKGIVARQAPQPDERARVGTGVTVWLAVPEQESTPPPPVETADPETTLSLDGLRTLAIADAKGIWVDPPGTGDSVRLNTVPVTPTRRGSAIRSCSSAQASCSWSTPTTNRSPSR